MPFAIPKTKAKLPPAGNHLGITTQVIDLGTQQPKDPSHKPARKIRLTWELPYEKEVFNEEKGEESFVVSKEYTLSMHEKSNFRKDLESWRGKKFTEAECSIFDETKIIGKPCFVQVIHNETASGTYANVSAVTGIPKGTTVPPQTNASIVYNTDDGQNTTFLALPEWLQEKIKMSPEFQSKVSPANAPEDGDAIEGDDASDSDIPF